MDRSKRERDRLLMIDGQDRLAHVKSALSFGRENQRGWNPIESRHCHIVLELPDKKNKDRFKEELEEYNLDRILYRLGISARERLKVLGELGMLRLTLVCIKNQKVAARAHRKDVNVIGRDNKKNAVVEFRNAGDVKCIERGKLGMLIRYMIDEYDAECPTWDYYNSLPERLRNRSDFPRLWRKWRKEKRKIL